DGGEVARCPGGRARRGHVRVYGPRSTGGAREAERDTAARCGGIRRAGRAGAVPALLAGDGGRTGAGGLSSAGAARRGGPGVAPGADRVPAVGGRSGSESGGHPGDRVRIPADERGGGLVAP